jgi:DNA-binding NarL/FixJ family response regulator
LSSDAHWANVIALFRVGVWGFVTKERSLDTLKAALRSISRGDRFVDGHTGGLLASTWGEVPGTTAEIALASLSKREREVFQLLIEGKNAREIAKSLYISPKTVEKHRRAVLQNLKVRDTADLMKFAARNRFLNP